MSAGSQSAGYRSFELFDAQMGMAFPTVVMYPSDSPERVEKIGPYTESVAMDASLAVGSNTLVVISHGTGGRHLLHRTLAAHLARNGFIVALPEHPRNNRNNDELAGTIANLGNRPRHMRLVMDWAFSSEMFGRSLQPNTAAIIGHSMGGYTALATAGGLPTAFAWETPEKQSRPVEVTPDNRVKALVLLAPAAAWFLAPGSLSGVRVPILMFSAEKDDLETLGDKTLPDGTTVNMPYGHSEIVKRGLPGSTPIEHRVVANAGHYSFLSPFPAVMTSPALPPSQDPPGFDRVRFHEEMNAEVMRFLRAVT